MRVIRMSEPKYDFEIDLSNPNSGHTMMIELIGSNKRVVEVGCATGYMSKLLSERGCRVVGVELDPEAASQAKEFCEDVIVGDVETLDLPETLGRGNFDVVIFGDVLEHLRDPLSAVRGIRPLLVPGGYVVTSIPNIAHGAVRLALMLGRFDYRPLGLLDDTHLRFFTRTSLEQFFRDAGFVPVEIRRTIVGLFETEIELNREDFTPEMIGKIEADPESLTYQFVTKAVVDDGVEAIRELHIREDAQRVRILQLEREIDSLKADLGRYDEEVSRLRVVEAEVGGVKEALAHAEEQIRQNVERWERLEKRRLVRFYRWLQKVSGRR